MLLCGQDRMGSPEPREDPRCLGTHRVPGDEAVLSRTLDGGERVQAKDEGKPYKTSNVMEIGWIPGSGDFSVLAAGTWRHT